MCVCARSGLFENFENQSQNKENALQRAKASKEKKNKRTVNTKFASDMVNTRMSNRTTVWMCTCMSHCVTSCERKTNRTTSKRTKKNNNIQHIPNAQYFFNQHSARAFAHMKTDMFLSLSLSVYIRVGQFFDAKKRVIFEFLGTF